MDTLDIKSSKDVMESWNHELVDARENDKVFYDHYEVILHMIWY